MAVSVKKAVLWRKELSNRPGTLAEALRPLAEAGVSLNLVMGYAYSGDQEHAAVEVFPVTSSKAEQAAKAAGLEPHPRLGCLLVTGNDRAGLGYHITSALAHGGINISFVMCQSSGKVYSAVFGFESAEEANKAESIIKDATKVVPMKGRSSSSARKAARPKAAAKKAGAKKKSTAHGGKKKTAKKKAPSRKAKKR